jgi:hypothetical protein
MLSSAGRRQVASCFDRLTDRRRRGVKCPRLSYAWRDAAATADTLMRLKNARLSSCGVEVGRCSQGLGAVGLAVSLSSLSTQP